ncbi:MAG: DUF302 domain-containing protein [Gammaproteobacteria bacterium]|jgi:uncharacterized protein (DUF302 family)
MYGFFMNYDGSFEEAVATTTEELKKEGFGVLTEIDVKQTLKTRLGVERRPYKILGACNPSFAHQALEREPNIGLLLPCNVVVREEDDGNISIGFMDPEAVLELVKEPAIGDLAKEVRKRLEKVQQALSAKMAA